MVTAVSCLFQIDEQMREELDELKLLVDKDKGGKGKVIRERWITLCICPGGLATVGTDHLELCLDIHFTPQKKKGSKGGKKKKKEKDLTSDR